MSFARILSFLEKKSKSVLTYKQSLSRAFWALN